MVSSLHADLALLTSTIFCIILTAHAKIFIGDCSYGFCEQECKQFEPQKLECFCRKGYILKPDGRRCLKIPDVSTGGSGDDEGSGEEILVPKVTNCDNEDGECDTAIVTVPQYSGDGGDDEDEGSGGGEVIVVPIIREYANPILNNIPHIVSVAFHFPRSVCVSKLDTNPYKFRNILQSQIVSVTALSADSVTEFKISCQSIVVRFKVGPSKELSVTSAVRRIRDLVTSGKLNIKLDGRIVRAIRSSFKSVRDPTYPFNENMLPKPKPLPKPPTPSTKLKPVVISSSNVISSVKPSTTQTTMASKTNLQRVVSTRVGTIRPKPTAVDTAKPSITVILTPSIVETPKPSTSVIVKPFEVEIQKPSTSVALKPSKVETLKPSKVVRPPTVLTPKPSTQAAKKKATLKSSIASPVSIIPKDDKGLGFVVSVVNTSTLPSAASSAIIPSHRFIQTTTVPLPFSTEITSIILRKIQPTSTSEITSKTTAMSTSESTRTSTSKVTSKSTSVKGVLTLSSRHTSLLASVTYIIQDFKALSSSKPIQVMSASLNTQGLVQLTSTTESTKAPVIAGTPVHPGPSIPVSSMVVGMQPHSTRTSNTLTITQREQHTIQLVSSTPFVVGGHSTRRPMIPMIKEVTSNRKASIDVVTSAPTKLSATGAIVSAPSTGTSSSSVGEGIVMVHPVQHSKLAIILASTKHVKITSQPSLYVVNSTISKIQGKITPVKIFIDTKSTSAKALANRTSSTSEVRPSVLSSTAKLKHIVITSAEELAHLTSRTEKSETISSAIKKRPQVTSSSRSEFKIPWSRVVEPSAASTAQLELSSTVKVGSGKKTSTHQRTTQVFIPSSQVQPSMRMRTTSFTGEISSTTRTKTTPLHDVIVTSRISRPSVLAHDSVLVTSHPAQRTSRQDVEPSSSTTIVETDGDFEVKIVIQKSFNDDGKGGGGGSRGCTVVANSFILLFLSSLLSYLFVL